MLSIKDIIEIAAIVIVGLGIIDAIRHDQNPYAADDCTNNSNQNEAGVDHEISLMASNTPPIPEEKCCKSSNEKSIRTEVFALLAAVGGIAAAIFTGWQAWTARDALLADQRAWIGVPEIAIEKISDDSVKFTFVFKNVGRTPTNGLYIDGNITTIPDWGSEIQRLCQKGETIAKTEPDFYLWSTIPGSPFPITWMPTKDFTKVRLDEFQKSVTNIAGCVVYGQRITNTLHKTGFIAPVDVRDGDVSVSKIWAYRPD